MNVKKFLRNHTNASLVFLAVVFLVLIVGAFVWGIGYIVTEANEAANGRMVNTPAPSFDLQDAAKLDYRGTMSQ